MRTGALILLAACSCREARADFSYQIRVEVTVGGAAEKSATTNLIKGNRMALLSKGHTRVIDLAAETITEIDYLKKTYSVIPFSQMKKVVEEATAIPPQETAFKVSVQNSGQTPSQTKVFGILTASEMALSLEASGEGSGEKIAVDAWIATVPGYTQMVDFNRRLAEKMGEVYASGVEDLVRLAPQTLQALAAAVKEIRKAPGAPLRTSITISAPVGTLAEVTILLDKFGGGIQDAARFGPPEGFKKVDATILAPAK